MTVSVFRTFFLLTGELALELSARRFLVKSDEMKPASYCRDVDVFPSAGVDKGTEGGGQGRTERESCILGENELISPPAGGVDLSGHQHAC